MSEFRTVEQIRALPDLKPQETELLEKAEAGEMFVLGDGKLPGAVDDSRSIRAGIIRYLLLGGCEGLRCHEKGAQIKGAFITDELNLIGCESDLSLNLTNCRFDARPVFHNAQLYGIYLKGSHCPGIFGDGLTLKRSLHLTEGFFASGEVQLMGAQISGDLACVAGTIINAGGYSLKADGLIVRGSVILNGLQATGEVRMPSAKIGMVFSCYAGTLNNEGGYALVADRMHVGGGVFLSNGFSASGQVALRGAKIVGDLVCAGGTFSFEAGYALNAYRAQIGGNFFWREGANANGVIQLTGAACAELNDDMNDWPDEENSLSLDGFIYGSISSFSATDAATRLKWLSLDNASGGFRPQPYQHLAKVLREMGHAEDARKVMVEKEKLQRADRLVRLKERLASMVPTTSAPYDQHAAQTTRVDRYQLKFDLWWSPKWNFLFRRLVGYGYYPFNSFWFGLGLFLFAAALFSMTWHSGAFAPNSPVVLISEEWAKVATLPNPAVEWEAGPGRDYETYNSLAYAFDTVIPLIDLGQETAWSPSTSRGPIGWIAWWAKWIFKVAGWIITALGAAALTGIIRRD